MRRDAPNITKSVRRPDTDPAIIYHTRDAIAAARDLAVIPGVRDFAIRRQVSPKCDHTFGITMRFADQDAYDHYNAHPRHVAFVRDRWMPEVVSFQEADFVHSLD